MKYINHLEFLMPDVIGAIARCTFLSAPKYDGRIQYYLPFMLQVICLQMPKWQATALNITDDSID